MKRGDKPTQTGEVSVTDHALIRWLERVHGIDMEGYRQMLAATLAPFIGPMATSVIVDGATYSLDRGKVITVVSGKFQVGSRQISSGKHIALRRVVRG